MRIPRRGAEAAVPEQDLDGAQIGPCLEEVGSKAVPEGMHGDRLAEARAGSCELTGMPYGVWRDGPIGISAGEQVLTGPDRVPVLAEDRQEPWREHDVAIFLPLGLA